MIKFDVTKTERRYLYQIAKRAAAMAHKLGFDYELLTAEMDLTACHANGNPLKLSELLRADDTNFTHDVFGIRRHINRDTGKLENYFSPRYSRPENYVDPEVKKEVVNILLKIKKMSEAEK